MQCAPPTAHNIATSEMAAVLLARAKRTNKDSFRRAKAFIRNNNASDRLTASWSAIEKQEMKKKMCVILKSAVVFHFVAVELCPG